MSAQHIAVAGVPGAGKSTLVRGLANRLGMMALVERFEENPYLGGFYREPKAWAFKNYVFFFQRTLEDYGRARSDVGCGGVQERVLEEHLLVFGEEFLARGYLSDSDFKLLGDLTRTARALVNPPDLLIHVELEPREAFARLRQRDSAVEEDVELEYVSALAARYERLLDCWSGKTMRIDGARNDFRDPQCLARLAEEVSTELSRGA